MRCMTADAPESSSIRWYRTPLPRDLHARLHERSDLLGFLQTGGYLGVLAIFGSLAVYSASAWPWWVTVGILFIHGTCYAFLINGFHELVHDSVFRTRWLNRFFLRILSFLGWLNHHHFWASHTEHHRYTLHPPDDLEVVFPVKFTRKDFWKSAIINWSGFGWMIGGTWRTARGILPGVWDRALFPPEKPEARRLLFRWARIVLLGHGCLVAVSCWLGWWMVPVVTTFAPFYGGWLFFLHNNTQHVGLVDNVPDFRLCCRTMIVNPVFQFLYWHMNFHTEHHMYAAVPCYRLGALHRAIRHDLPHCPDGLLATWREIAVILERQAAEPGYQYRAPLPAAGTMDPMMVAR